MFELVTNEYYYFIALSNNWHFSQCLLEYKQLTWELYDLKGFDPLKADQAKAEKHESNHGHYLSGRTHIHTNTTQKK